MKNKIQIKTEDKLQQLERLLKHLTESAVEAGKLIVELVQEDPANYDKIKARFGFNDFVMERFQNLGLGRLLPKIAFDLSPAASFIENLGVDDQKKVVEQGVVIVRGVNGDKIEAETVPYHKLTYKQAQSVFSGKEIKTVAQQAEKLKEKLIVLPPQPTYEVIGDTIHFRDATFKLVDLEALVAKVKETLLKSLESEIKQKQVAK